MKKQIIIAVILSGVLVLSGCTHSGSVMSPTPDSTLNTASPTAPDPAPSGAGPTPDAAPPSAAPTPDLTPSGAGPAPDLTPSGRRDAIPFEPGQLYAAAYLGYRTADGLDYYAQRYLDSGRLPVHYVSDGDYYLVIPRYDGMTLSLYVNDLETSLGTLRFRDPDCGPFVIQCNASDVFNDVTVRLEYNGETAEFSPYISLKDGAVMLGERGLDLTRPGTAGGAEGPAP